MNRTNDNAVKLDARTGAPACPRHGPQRGAEYRAQDPAPCGCTWVWENGQLIAVPSRRDWQP